jgi:hypothetical protein
VGVGAGVSTGVGVGATAGAAGFEKTKYRAMPRTTSRIKTMMATAAAVFFRCFWAFMGDSFRTVYYKNIGQCGPKLEKNPLTGPETPPILVIKPV